MIWEPTDGWKSRPHSPYQASVTMETTMSGTRRLQWWWKSTTPVPCQSHATDWLQTQPMENWQGDSNVLAMTSSGQHSTAVNDNVINLLWHIRKISICCTRLGFTLFLRQGRQWFDAFLLHFVISTKDCAWGSNAKLTILKLCLQRNASALIRILCDFFGRWAWTGTSEVRLQQRVDSWDWPLNN